MYTLLQPKENQTLASVIPAECRKHRWKEEQRGLRKKERKEELKRKHSTLSSSLLSATVANMSKINYKNINNKKQKGNN